MIGDVVRGMDLFGSGFDFKMNMRNRIYSWKGGLLSIFLMIGSLFYLIICCINLFNNVYTTKSTKQFMVRLPKIEISSNNEFMFAYCLVRNNNSSQQRDQIFENSVNYTLKWRSVSKLPDRIQEEVFIKTKKCSIEMFDPRVVNRWNFKYFEGCSCVTPDQLDQNISYFMTDSYYTFYDFEVKFNDTILNNKTMYNQIIDYFNNNTPVGNFYYVDTTVDIDKYTKAFSYFMNIHSQYVNPTSQVTSNLYLTSVNLVIDDNPFYHNIIPYNGISIIKESVNIKTGISYDLLSNYNCLHSIKLYASNQSLFLSRTNLKYDAFIGNLFSFLYPFFLILRLINNKINSLEAKQNLIHHLFKNYRFNNQVIKKIKLIRDRFDELEERKDSKDQIVDIGKVIKTDCLNSETSKKDLCSQGSLFINLESPRSLKRSFRIIRSDKKKNYLKNDEIKKISLRKLENDFNNDPLALEYNKRADERIYYEEIFKKINEIDFKYDWFKYFFMKCTKNKEKFLIRQKYFESHESLVDYYMDVSTYFKKMIEVDIIMHLNFTSQQKKLLSYCSNINFSFKAQEKIKEKLNDIYYRTSVIDDKLEREFTDIILNAKQDETSEKIVELVQNNNIIFFD